jgi:hypothetical protein
MTELLHIQISEFKGKYPDIALPDNIDREAFGDKPFFATLPIGEIGARSRNKRTYEESSIRDLVDEVNAKRPRGWWGHPTEDDRKTTPPAVQWLAAVLDDNGLAWGKVVTLSENAGGYLRSAKATRSKIGTSILGDGKMEGDKVVGIDLAFIDLVAEPDWVGVPATAAVPHLTSETRKDEDDMPTEINEQFLAELRGDRDKARTRISELETQVHDLQPLAEQVTQVRKLLAEYADSFASASINVNASGSDFIQVIRELADKLVAISADQLANRISTVVGEMVKVPADTASGKALREYVGLAMGKVKDETEAKAKLTEIMAGATYQTLAKAIVTEQVGPNVVTNATKPVVEGAINRDEMTKPENAKKIAEQFGVA